MSSVPEDTRSVAAPASDPIWDHAEHEGGHNSWIDPPNGEAGPSTQPITQTPSFGSRPPEIAALAASSRGGTSSLPASLPRHLSTQSLGRAGLRSARTSADSSRRPRLVDRVTSSRSLFLPSIAYSDLHDSGSNVDGDAEWRSSAVGATPLDRTMDRIGMGRYQWTVLILSGLGWAADNMWIQAIAIILPHIQRYFILSDGIVGLASSSIFVGMFIGSIAWGTISDSFGRRAAFNITLAVAAVFGGLSALAGSFPLLCLLLFAVGTGVGGSMPTDSSNLVENLPVRKHSYVTALSIFFSAGSVVSSLIGLAVLSAHNPQGWRWLLGSLAFVTVLFVSARVVFFRLLESPKYLVHAGRPQEARDILQKIHKYNGGATIALRIQDVDDHSRIDVPGSSTDLERRQSSSAASQSKDVVQEGNDERSDGTADGHRGSRWTDGASHTYSNDEEADGDVDGHDLSSRPLLDRAEDDGEEEGRKDYQNASRIGRGAGASSSSVRSVRSLELPASLAWLPESWHPSAADLSSRFAEMFSPEWKRTTLLIWIIWGGMSYGFTTFNVLLPKLLEQRYDSPDSAAAALAGSAPDDASIRRAMLDILVYSLSSLPGSLIAAYMVETRLGRIGTMVISTCIMALSMLLFSLTFWRSSLTVVSVSSSISYAVIYGYTPEVMAPTIRGTACGTASAISRVAGIVAPLLAGWAYSIVPALPLFIATSALVVVTAAMALLPIETRGRAVDPAQIAH
ncbi:MFS general substrate transporter [Moesziomyces antarcticus]|uniref:Major facilitator superfamily (MFS) profile domain-containing protein n=1 Tax=Pseudozyma antarctica TaxID=84753 RepID=A0A5C3FHL2_PSEA2|nr:MFS general substrate transporter [Moesziomyces antarcticus]GAK62466.1 MFS general substrate transporter [Moesziomyces antarcticus]SPO43021.1 uncharacterized protein PSANT_00705 [Moesziomyces antarcticus]